MRQRYRCGACGSGGRVSYDKDFPARAVMLDIADDHARRSPGCQAPDIAGPGISPADASQIYFSPHYKVAADRSRP